MVHTRTGRVRRWMATGVALGLAASLAACGGGSDDEPGAGDDAGSSTSAAQDVQPRAGGTLRVLTWLETRGFDPVEARAMTTGTGPRMTAVFDALVLDDVESGALQLRLAESMESEDGITWTIGLRPGVTFTDGTPFDAEAVKFNWERLETGVPEIASMTVEDPLTLVVTLPAADTQFPMKVAETPLTWIGSPTAIQERGEGFNTDPVGAGPFMVERWVRDNELVLVRNPDYYGEAYVDEIVMRIVPDETQRLATLQSGEADIAMSPVPAFGADAESAGFSVLRGFSHGGRTIQFNKTKAPFDDVRARRAVALAFDAAALVDAVHAGEGDVLSQVLQPSSPYHDPGAAQVAPDAAEAQRLFDELAAEGTPVEFTMLAFPSQANEAEWFAGILESYDNVEVDIEIPDVLQILPRFAELDYQMSLSAVPITHPSQLSDYLVPGSQFYGYSGGYDDPDVIEALQVAQSTFDEDIRTEAYATVQEKLAEDVVFHFYLPLSVYYAFRDGVEGLDPTFLYSARALPLWERIWLAE